MKEIKTTENQTLFDIAAMYYGTCEAVGEIIRNNPELANDDRVKVQAGIDSANDRNFYPDLALKPGSVICIDNDSRLIRKNSVREIEKEVTTFKLTDYGTDHP